MSHVRVANAPCSWGTLEFDGLKGERVGWEQMLNELVGTGYVGTELGDWGFMPTDPAELNAALRQRGVTMVGAFVPVALKYPDRHEEGVAEALKYARLLAAVAEAGRNAWSPVIVLADLNGTDPTRTTHAGRVTPEMGLTAAEWRAFAAGAERVARAVRTETGLRTAFHHHCAGFVETPDEIARLLSMTDPAMLGLVFDTGHYMYGTGTDDGPNVKEGLDRFGDRVWHLHFKDCEPQVAARARAEGWDYFAAVQHGMFCELGQGNVDFASVTAWLQRGAFNGWIVVEQDVLPGMGEPRISARRNRDYIRSLGV